MNKNLSTGAYEEGAVQSKESSIRKKSGGIALISKRDEVCACIILLQCVDDFSPHINVDCLNGDIFVISTFISTHPHLNVIGGGLWQLLVEPWRSIEAAACAQRPTASTIPQRIIIIKRAKLIAIMTPSITEIIVSVK